jgi:hypothetical protein
MPTLPFVPQVVVKFADFIPINLAQGQRIGLNEVAALLGPFAAPAVLALSGILPNLVFRRLFDALSAGELEDLVSRARGLDPSYTPPRFESFLEIVCPAGFQTTQLVTSLRQLVGIVDLAYEITRTENSGVIGTLNAKFHLQKYLFPAVGINAQSAWAKGADGKGLRLIDIEHAWFLAHEDLPQNIRLLRGISDTSEQGHGTAVLGVIGAVDNAVGVVGIAPSANIGVVSVIERDPAQPVFMEHVASMITFAAHKLKFGDVLLLEMQLERRPVELDRAVFHAIDLATRSGIVVVEAAGNGGLNLDNQSFFGDSGAIIVGACRADPPHARWVGSTSASNFGTKVDCNAWGEKVHTTGCDIDPVRPNEYFDFRGTSAASAIIAGVCLLIQHLHLIKMALPGASPLNPNTIRRILRKRGNGTQSPDVDRIGVMPDLSKIIVNESL